MDFTGFVPIFMNKMALKAFKWSLTEFSRVVLVKKKLVVYLMRWNFKSADDKYSPFIFGTLLVLVPLASCVLIHREFRYLASRNLQRFSI